MSAFWNACFSVLTAQHVSGTAVSDRLRTPLYQGKFSLKDADLPKFHNAGHCRFVHMVSLSEKV